MEPIPYSHLEKGTFLIATPEVEAGFYHRTVILLCEHTPGGSFGVAVNKPLDVELPADLLNIDKFTNPSVGLRTGGPLQTNQMMLLHNSPKIPDQTIDVCENTYLGGDLAFLQETVSDPEGPKLLMCFGYSAWSGGQLEREFLDGQWFLCPANPAHLFETPPEKLWQTLLREMGGKYATLSMIPEDLSLN